MRLIHWKLAATVLFMCGEVGATHAQNAVEQLQPLVETTAHRLIIGEQVALAKWDSGKAVEDAPRETQVIRAAVKAGMEKGLDEGAVSSFFNAQIEANKFVQYGLLADWYRAGKAPEHAPIDLVKSVRPQLDVVQESLIAELLETLEIRKSGSCRANISKAVARYLSTHPQATRPSITAATLDRALAGACVP